MLPDVNIGEGLMRESLGLYREEGLTRVSGDLDLRGAAGADRGRR
jgi:hypothetical protein